MTITTQLKRGLTVAAFGVAALAAPAVHAYTINFDGLSDGAQVNGDTTALTNGVSFASGLYDDILDANGDPTGLKHWIAYTADIDPSVGPLLAGSPAAIGWGAAASGARALDGRFDQVLMRFSAPLQLAAFSFATDSSSYGFPGYTNLQFLDSDGQVLALSNSYIQAGTNSFTADFSSAPLTVSGVLLPSGRFYDNLTVTAVPEPGTYALMLSGLLLLGASMRRHGKR